GGDKRYMASEENLKQKIEEVNELAKKIKASKIVILADYRGINVEDVTNLRSKLRGASTEYKIIKNNIISRALGECKIEGLEESLVGPTALIFGEGDYLEPSKIIYDYAKENDFYKIKGGIIEGKVVTAEEIITLAKLPSRETLIAQLAGALLGNITKLAVGLEQVRLQKESA
ncbi:MAG: 50S ribosomal protein L10, partial [Oscillospiraceae bacterium]|nr:50S ribosomal protein L10 [Oscillospiraceae bacterium]